MKRLLAEAYRPNTIDGYIFQNPTLKTQIQKWTKTSEIPNILLEGTAGTGKTTLSRILVNEMDIDPMDVLTINASMLSMDQIRNMIEPFIAKASFSKFKIIQLEEFDRISQIHQQSLRAIIEDSSDRVRWIATCNYVNKLIPAILSRFQVFTIDAMDQFALLNYIVGVVESEALIVNDDDDLLSHIEAHQPDVRKILNSIDQHTDEDKTLHKLSTASSSTGLDELEQIWVSGKASKSIDSLLTLHALVDNTNYEQVFEIMYSNLHNFEDPAAAVIAMSTYLDRAGRVANQRLNLDAFVYEVFVVGKE
jgi:replication-associated recombination protein RarA